MNNIDKNNTYTYQPYIWLMFLLFSFLFSFSSPEKTNPQPSFQFLNLSAGSDIGIPLSESTKNNFYISKIEESEETLEKYTFDSPTNLIVFNFKIVSILIKNTVLNFCYFKETHTNSFLYDLYCNWKTPSCTSIFKM